MSTDIHQYHGLSQPPAWALKKIQGGRLTGMTDINPQWRIQAMTEAYGLCGVGWKFEVVAKWTEPGPEGQVFVFADVHLYVKVDGEWSDPIPGNGGNKLVEKESRGLHANDEAFKMAITDALSTAMKMIGVAADIYAGMWDGTKYKRGAEPPEGGVTRAQLGGLKLEWEHKHKDLISSMSPDEQQVARTRWVKDIVGHDVSEFREWTPEDLDKCEEALK